MRCKNVWLGVLLTAGVAVGQTRPGVVAGGSGAATQRGEPTAEQYRGAQAADRKWLADLEVSGYEKAGVHGAWDDAVRAALKADTGEKAPGETEAAFQLRVGALYKKAQDLGCQDPLVSYRSAIRMEPTDLATTKARARQFEAAADAYLKSSYPGYLKRQALAEANASTMLFPRGDGKDQDRAKDYYEQEISAFVQLVKTPGISTDRLVLAAEWTRGTGETMHDDIEELVENYLNKAGAQEALAVVKGRTLMRGMLKASETGNEETAWAAVQTRCKEIRALLPAAWAKDPMCSTAAESMIDVCTTEHTLLKWGQPMPGDKRTSADIHAEIEKWFARAMAANPDDSAACELELRALRPVNGGSTAAMLKFGKAMWATQRWSGRVPMMLVRAHEQIQTDTGGNDAYWKQPAVWGDIKMCYEALLKQHPASIVDRTWYLKFAVRAEAWDVAAAQIKVLGDTTAGGVLDEMGRYPAVKALVGRRGK